MLNIGTLFLLAEERYRLHCAMLQILACVLIVSIPRTVFCLDVPGVPMPEINFKIPEIPELSDNSTAKRNQDFFKLYIYYKYVDDDDSLYFPIIRDYPIINRKTRPSKKNLILDLKWAEDALYDSPRNPQRYVNRGVVRFNNTRYQDALGDFENALKNGYSSPWICYYNIALVYWHLGKEEKFLEFLQKTFDSKDDFYRAHMISGDYYYTQGDFDKAIDFYKKALEISTLELRRTDLWDPPKELIEIREKDKTNKLIARDITHIKTRLFAACFMVRNFKQYYPEKRTLDASMINNESYAYLIWLAKYIMHESSLNELESLCEGSFKRLRDFMDAKDPELRSMLAICNSINQMNEMPDADDFEAQASDAYDAERYYDAVDNYLAAFILSDNDPIIIYNLAMSYYELHKKIEAAFYMKHYKHLTSDPDADDMIAEIAKIKEAQN